MLTPEIILLIDELLICPKASRAFLLREMITAFIQNLILIVVFTLVLYESSFSAFECSPTISVWFTF